MLEKMREYFSQPDPDVVIAYQYKVPNSINVDINKDNGHYILHVDSINGEKLKNTTFYVEADTVNDLIYELNDSVLEYLDFPQNVKPKMPKLLPPKEFLEQEGIHLQEKLVFAK